MICRANISDIEQIKNLGITIDNYYYSNLYIPDVLNSKNKLLLVYKEQNSIVAFIYLNIFDTEMEIIDLIVEENNRRKNIATKLCNYVFKTLNTDCYLDVNVNNEGALILYKNLGFEEIGYRKKYYLNGDDAYIMKRKIK